MSRKVFTADEILTAEDVNSYLMDQTVMSFAGTAARGSAILTPVEGMVTYLEDSDRYESYSGSTWLPVISTGAWVSYTPTLTNMTLGNGSMSARYAVIGKTMHLSFVFTLGSTSAMSSQPRISLPVGFTTVSTLFQPVGTGFAFVAGLNWITETLPINSGAIYAVVSVSNQVYTTIADITSTAPATWGTGNVLSMKATLELA